MFLVVPTEIYRIKITLYLTSHTVDVAVTLRLYKRIASSCNSRGGRALTGTPRRWLADTHEDTKRHPTLYELYSVSCGCIGKR